MSLVDLPHERREFLTDYAEDIWEHYSGECPVAVEQIVSCLRLGPSYDDFGTAFDGILEHRSGRFHIFCNIAGGLYPNHPRVRFTLGHELGHYFIDEHRNALLAGLQPEPVEKDVSHNVNPVHEVYFLSFGDSTDPNPEFMRRFSDFKIPVKPISAGVWRGMLIYDKVSGESGAAFYVKDIFMLNQDEAEVEAVIHPEGGLSTSGLVYRVFRKGGKWTVTSEKLKWIS